MFNSNLDPVRSKTAIYDGRRRFLGRRDLVISFYTMKCQFQCTYCALPLQSANLPVTAEDLDAQINEVFDRRADALSALQQISFGNEGSVFDRVRFHQSSLELLLERTAEAPRLEVLSIETRPEYINADKLEHVRRRTRARVLDVTVGFETQDDELRQGLMNKSISRRNMEKRIALLGESGVRLTAYVMVKPGPRMTEAQGVAEAVATMDYLAEQTARHGVDLVIYLTPNYVAEGSTLARTVRREDYLPPTIQSILEVVLAGHGMGLPVYSGLWSEGLADEAGDFRGREGYDPAMRDALLAVNRTDNRAALVGLYAPAL